MDTAATSLEKNTDALSYPADYTSEMLQLYVRRLGKLSRPAVVDLGPVCEENIMFFAKRAKRHHVCDLFIRMDRHRRQPSGRKTIWDHFDYPEQSFNGIHAWDLLDRLDDREARRLLEICHLANIAMRLDRELEWDPVQREIIGDDQANSFLARKSRSGYEINM